MTNVGERGEVRGGVFFLLGGGGEDGSLVFTPNCWGPQSNQKILYTRFFFGFFLVCFFLGALVTKGKKKGEEEGRKKEKEGCN